ncbi:MAG: MoxR family ATPase [Bacteroidota bacterium]
MQPLANTYLPGPGLEAVIELALEMGRPLLVTGEPGTGKTRLADFVAQKLKLDPPLVFNTKTDAQAIDLFYSYDAIRHYRDSARPDATANALEYISFQALGQAILESGEKRNVVLIDEIDKAPRDFANDLLFEFEELAFQVKEASTEETKAFLGDAHEVDEQGFIRVQKGENRPVLILTSNSEKNLPDAFMRRVLYHHIEFPTHSRLQEIVAANVPDDIQLNQVLVEAAIEHFEDIRENKRLRKRPATAELLAWIHVLHRKQERADLQRALEADSPREVKMAIFNTYSLIAKNKDDLATLKRDLGL